MSQTQLTSCIVTHAGSRYARYTLSLVIYSSSLSQTSSSSLLISNAIICVSCFFYKFLITSIWPQHSMQLVYVYFCKYVLSMCTVIHKCNCDVAIWLNFFCHSIIHADLFSDVPKHCMFISLDYYRVPVHLNTSECEHILHSCINHRSLIHSVHQQDYSICCKWIFVRRVILQQGSTYWMDVIKVLR